MVSFIIVHCHHLRSLTCIRNSGTVVAEIARSRAEIESARLLVLSAALQVSVCTLHCRFQGFTVLKIDKERAKGALKEIGIAKARPLESFLFLYSVQIISFSSLYLRWPAEWSTVLCKHMVLRA